MDSGYISCSRHVTRNSRYVSRPRRVTCSSRDVGRSRYVAYARGVDIISGNIRGSRSVDVTSGSISGSRSIDGSCCVCSARYVSSTGYMRSTRGVSRAGYVCCPSYVTGSCSVDVTSSSIRGSRSINGSVIYIYDCACCRHGACIMNINCSPGRNIKDSRVVYV